LRYTDTTTPIFLSIYLFFKNYFIASFKVQQKITVGFIIITRAIGLRDSYRSGRTAANTKTFSVLSVPHFPFMVGTIVYRHGEF
jgi:hypothetical protein